MKRDNAGMLPDGFQWVPRYQRAPPGELALDCNGLHVAQLTQKLDGTWLARLKPFHALFSPEVARDCTSHEAGVAGIEAWACRHEAHLREQAALYEASRPRHRGAS